MSKKYEALVIFSKAVRDDDLEGALGRFADELQKLGFNIDRKTIVVKDVKAAGEYVATVKLHKEVAAQVPFTVVAENAPAVQEAPAKAEAPAVAEAPVEEAPASEEAPAQTEE